MAAYVDLGSRLPSPIPLSSEDGLSCWKFTNHYTWVSGDENPELNICGSAGKSPESIPKGTLKLIRWVEDL